MGDKWTREIKPSDGVTVYTLRGTIRLMQFDRLDKDSPSFVELTARDARLVAVWLLELANEIEGRDA